VGINEEYLNENTVLSSYAFTKIGNNFLKGVFGYLLGAFFSFVFLYANNVSSIVCIVSNFIFNP
jgi:hypothetical protein